MTRRQQVHQSYLGENLAAHDPAVQEKINSMSEIIAHHGVSNADAKSHAMSMMYQNLQNQAAF